MHSLIAVNWRYTGYMTVLKLKNVTKRYGTKLAVDDVSMSIEKGEIFGFLGPNGAGKTTTIRMVLSTLRPTQGEIKIFGQDSSHTVQLHKRIGFLSGDMAMDDDLTGAQYLNFIAHRYGKDCTKTIKELSALLKADLAVKIRDYSRGNRQKIGLIAALMHNPELLVLDEPTSGFDPLVQEQFMELIRTYKSTGGTVFMSSHILSEVQQLCDRVAFIRDGAVAGTKTINEITMGAAKKVTIKADKAQLRAVLHHYKTVPSLTLIATNVHALTFTYSDKPKKLLQFLSTIDADDIIIEEPDLEQIFMTYYEGAKEVSYA